MAKTMSAPSDTTTAVYDAIIIGSGFGGLYALHHLRDEMGLSVRAFEFLICAVGALSLAHKPDYPGIDDLHYFDRLKAIADEGFEGFVFEEKRVNADGR